MISSLSSSIIQKTKRLLESNTVRNSIWIIAERIFSVGILAIITILSARYLGAVNFGIVSYGTSFVVLFLGIMQLGLDAIIVNELLIKKDKQGEILGSSLVLRLASSVISIVMILLLVLFINHNNPMVIVVVAVQTIMLLFQAFYIFDYWFQSRLESKYVSIAKIISSIVVSLYSIYLLLSGKNIVWFALSLSISSLVIAILLIYFYKRNSGEVLRYSRSTSRYLLGKSYHFILASIIVAIYIQIDKLLIANMLNNQQLGLYSAALTICLAWVFLPNAIITSIRPSIFSAKLHSEKKYLRRLKQLYFIIFWTSFFIAGIIALLSPWLIHILFGSEYKDSANVLAIVIWSVPFSMLGVARNIWFIGENKQKYAKNILIYGLIINVGLNLLLLQRIGILGAAIATVITEIVTCFIAPLFYKAVRPHTKILLEALAYKFN